MRNFNKVEFSDAISEKSTRLRFSDIHNPGLWFFHRWMPFMLFPMAKLNSVVSPELKCLFAMINRIKYTPVADIVGYFKNVHKISGPIECTSMVTQIAMNLGCPKIDCTLVKVLHCSLIGWERCTKASQDHLTLTGELVWRQRSRPQLHHMLTLRSPSGTLGMGVASRVTMRVVVTTPLMVAPSLASEPKPPLCQIP
jgi:hypothetical protein